MPRIADIIAAIEEEAPLSIQESWDNSGLQIGRADTECTGVMLALDPTEKVVEEAIGHGCNLIVSHHPLIFHAPKQIIGATAQQRAIERALRGGVAIYSAHTSLDNAPNGLNRHVASRLGLTEIEPLVPLSMPGAGSGAVGNLPHPISGPEFVDRVKATFGSPVVRCSSAIDRYSNGSLIHRVALCTGSGSSMIDDAEASGAQVFLTADTRYHDFLDRGSENLMIADIGHHESELAARDIFYRLISGKFSNFAPRFSISDMSNPIVYA
ncbi:MAG: Nif3-like dinuclear metal center hexameric protein [Bacteroides sp.]|nr:Nif3-like dinuclear metal center hexameric protein [Bacteroides sp.]